MMSDMFSVLDMVAGLYGEPFFAPNPGVAIRSFGQATQQEAHQFAQYPEDFALYHIGTFDSTLGVVSPAEPRKIAVATQFTGGAGNQLDLLEKEEHHGS